MEDGAEECGRTMEERQRWKWLTVDRWGRRVRRDKGERIDVELVQRSEEEQARKDRGRGGAEE